MDNAGDNADRFAAHRFSPILCTRVGGLGGMWCNGLCELSTYPQPLLLLESCAKNSRRGEATVRIYDRNTARPHGTPERKGGCLAVVYVQGAAGASHQCTRNATHNRHGQSVWVPGSMFERPELCKQHAGRWRSVQIPNEEEPLHP